VTLRYQPWALRDCEGWRELKAILSERSRQELVKGPETMPDTSVFPYTTFELKLKTKSNNKFS
jgi:hypothetical protein